MKDLVEAAARLQDFLIQAGLEYYFIGGMAVQAWGEPRVTRDVDVSVMTGFGDEDTFIDRLTEYVQPRYENARKFAITNRVLLAYSPEGVAIDIAMAAFDFERRALKRAQFVQYLPDISLKVCSAEDLLVYKVFAGRPQDWGDVRSILVRQGNALKMRTVEKELRPLLDGIEQPERWDELLKLQHSV